MLELGDIAARSRSLRDARLRWPNRPVWRYQEPSGETPVEPARVVPTCQAARGFLVAAPLSAMLWGIIAVAAVRIF